MPTLSLTAGDGVIYEYKTDTFANVRALGTTPKSIQSNSNETIDNSVVSGRGSAANNIGRYYFKFDSSSITSTVSSATLKIYGQGHSGLDVIILKSSQSGTLAQGDFDAITGAASALSSSDGVGAGRLSTVSAVKKYSAVITTWSTSGYNDITLTADALADLQSLSTFACVMIGNEDYMDQAPTGSNRTGFHTDAYTGTSRDPYIDYTLAPTATENSIFFGTNF